MLSIIEPLNCETDSASVLEVQFLKNGTRHEGTLVKHRNCRKGSRMAQLRDHTRQRDRWSVGTVQGLTICV
jgi:hypothetical protein